MFRQKCSYRNDTETRKNPKSKEKNNKVWILKKKKEAKLPAANTDI